MTERSSKYRSNHPMSQNISQERFDGIFKDDIAELLKNVRDPKGKAVISAIYSCHDKNGIACHHGEDCVHTTATHGCNRCGYKVCVCGE